MGIIPLAEISGKEQSVADALLEAALEYTRRGWRVFPLHNPSDDGCSCAKPGCDHIGKHPRTPNGYKDASSELAKIFEWWSRWPNANIGIATGGSAGFFVLDVDGKDGDVSLQALTAEHGGLPKTLCAKTGRKGTDGKHEGRHHYLRAPEGATVLNSAGELGRGLDIRGEGGYPRNLPTIAASSFAALRTRQRCRLPEFPRPHGSEPFQSRPD